MDNFMKSKNFTLNFKQFFLEFQKCLKFVEISSEKSREILRAELNEISRAISASQLSVDRWDWCLWVWPPQLNGNWFVSSTGKFSCLDKTCRTTLLKRHMIQPFSPIVWYFLLFMYSIRSGDWKTIKEMKQKKLKLMFSQHKRCGEKNSPVPVHLIDVHLIRKISCKKRSKYSRKSSLFDFLLGSIRF